MNFVSVFDTIPEYVKSAVSGNCRLVVICTELFSASEQTHCACALIACNSERVTVASHSPFRLSTEVVYVWLVQDRCRKVKLLPTQHTFCVHHTTVHQFTVLFEALLVSCIMCLALIPATSTFGRMTGIFYV